MFWTFQMNQASEQSDSSEGQLVHELMHRGGGGLHLRVCEVIQEAGVKGDVQQRSTCTCTHSTTSGSNRTEFMFPFFPNIQLLLGFFINDIKIQIRAENFLFLFLWLKRRPRPDLSCTERFLNSYENSSSQRNC